MIRSMTGSGCGRSQSAGSRYIVEVNSWNHRFHDLSVKLPPYLALLEPRLRAEAKAWIARGHVNVHVHHKDLLGRSNVAHVDSSVWTSVVAAFRGLQRTARLPGELTLSDMVRIPGLVLLERRVVDVEKEWHDLRRAFEKAMRQVVAMRKAEGRALASVFRAQLSRIASIEREIRKDYPRLLAKQRERLGRKVSEILGGRRMDKERLELELILYAERSDIREELDRIRSHVAQFRGLLAEREPVGRRLEFLTQEFNREFNTIASKVGDTRMTGWVVEVKGILETIREQLQNIE